MILTFDTLWPLNTETSNPKSINSSQNLAYVIYTSGSTGKPKGVMVSHQNLSNYVGSIISCLKAEREFLKFAQLSTCSADLGNTTLYSSILSGSQLHLLKDQLGFNGTLLASYIKNYNIDIIKIVPSHLDALGYESNLQELLPRKYLILGGDILTNQFLMRIKEGSVSTLQFINHYGPTETTVGCCLFLVRDQKINKNSVPIGFPIHNTITYILDQNFNPVPIGVKGELYIGGVGVTRGYLHQPDLTAEKFIPNRFIDKEINKNIKHYLRLYRTGDLARYNLDGNIEFLGRMDEQTKIRGFRVELAEIEAILNTHGDVLTAVVIPHENEIEHKQLRAYIVPKTFTPSFPELKKFLSEKLPDYMIPSSLVVIDKIPLKPNGKIDRKALFSMGLASREFKRQYIAPRTNLESSICKIMSKILKINKVGIFDDFFKMGGDSILSIQFVSKARQQGIYFSAKDVINFPTPESLSVIAKTKQNFDKVKIFNYPKNNLFPLTSIQHSFFNKSFSNINTYAQIFLLLCHDRIDFEILKKSISFLISYHDAFQFRYHSSPSGWKQEFTEIITPSMESFCSYIDLSNIADDILAARIEQKITSIQQELNIEKGHLIKVALFECGKRRNQRLSIIIHHLIIDGVSWRIIIEDLETIYKQSQKAKTPFLPSKTNSYRQWALALENYANSNNFSKEISYWQDLEKRMKPIPTDFDLGSFTKAKINTVMVSLSQEDTIQLLQEANQVYKTQITDILLAALVLSFGDWKGTYELSLHMEGHGREQIIDGIDVSRTVGWFTSIFPLYLDVNTSLGLADTIKIIKEEVASIPHKGVNYNIINYLARKKSLSNPQPSLVFNYLGQWDNVLNHQRLFSIDQEVSLNVFSNQNHLSYPLIINGKIEEKILSFSWTYSCNHYSKNTIIQISSNFISRLKEILRLCYDAKEDRTNHIIVPLAVSKRAPIIFFVHPIGGEVFWYKELSVKLSFYARCYGIKSIFLDQIKKPLIGIEEISFIYLNKIKEIQPKGPYTIIGWSFGAMIAYEISKQNTIQGNTPGTTIILDQASSVDYKRIEKEIQEIQVMHNIDPQTTCKLLIYKSLLEYKLSGCIERICLFKSQELEKYRKELIMDEFLGWKAYSRAINSYIIGSNHFSILEEPFINFIAKIIKENL